MEIKSIVGTVKAERDLRRITFVASHQRVDRDGEVIVIAGMDIDEFQRNPVLFTQHDTRQTGVARVIRLEKTRVDGLPALVGTAEFPDLPRSQEVLAEVRSGLLNAVSVGFQVLERGPAILEGQTGATFIKTRLVEISLVSVPSCATCLVTSKSACRCGNTTGDDVLADIVLPEVTLDLDDTPVLDLVDEHTLIDYSPSLIASVIGQTVRRVMQQEAAAAARSRINYLRGRVD